MWIIDESLQLFAWKGLMHFVVSGGERCTDTTYEILSSCMGNDFYYYSSSTSQIKRGFTMHAVRAALKPSH